ncbi:hypothetical protein [Nonomuraea sp. NPDC049141]|uniref:hypothetical protein n=1 Tax=unclassified Nonomuraea TaxID=2593643 RepID=UPI0034099CB4
MESRLGTQLGMEHLACPAYPPLWITSAEQLKRELADLNITADVHDGYRLALVSVWAGLVVWCDGAWFWWRSGWDDRRKRVVYARHPATEPPRAARRVAFRYTDLREKHQSSEVTADPACADPGPPGKAAP